MSAPLIIITCIFHSVFVTLNMNFRISIKNHQSTITGNMDHILTLQHLNSEMNILLYSTTAWSISKLFEIRTHSEFIVETPIRPGYHLDDFRFHCSLYDELCLVVIDFSANIDWTLNEALKCIIVLVKCIFCVASECAGI